MNFSLIVSLAGGLRGTCDSSLFRRHFTAGLESRGRVLACKDSFALALIAPE